jgi:hypothetical protein
MLHTFSIFFRFTNCFEELFAKFLDYDSNFIQK